jgi:hypothetical protein
MLAHGRGRSRSFCLIETRSGFVDLVEGAALAQVRYHTMYDWVLRGLVRAERIHGRWRLDVASLEAFLRARARAAALPDAPQPPTPLTAVPQP